MQQGVQHPGLKIVKHAGKDPFAAGRAIGARNAQREPRRVGGQGDQILVYRPGIDARGLALQFQLSKRGLQRRRRVLGVAVVRRVDLETVGRGVGGIRLVRLGHRQVIEFDDQKGAERGLQDAAQAFDQVVGEGVAFGLHRPDGVDRAGAGHAQGGAGRTGSAPVVDHDEGQEAVDMDAAAARQLAAHRFSGRDARGQFGDEPGLAGRLSPHHGWRLPTRSVRTVTESRTSRRMASNSAGSGVLVHSSMKNFLNSKAMAQPCLGCRSWTKRVHSPLP